MVSFVYLTINAETCLLTVDTHISVLIFFLRPVSRVFSSGIIHQCLFSLETGSFHGTFFVRFCSVESLQLLQNIMIDY